MHCKPDRISLTTEGGSLEIRRKPTKALRRVGEWREKPCLTYANFLTVRLYYYYYYFGPET